MKFIKTLLISLVLAIGLAIDPAPPLPLNSISAALAQSVETVNVKTFGAKGDGVTDDAVAIQAAVDSVTSGTIFFPPGTYRITKSIFVGKFSTSGNGQSSFSWGANGTRFWGGTVVNAKSGMRFRGAMGGYHSTSKIAFDGATSLPMFVVIGSDGVSFEATLPLECKLSSGPRASEGIWLAAGVVWQNKIDTTIQHCKRGLRFGDKKNWTEDPVVFTSYWPAIVTTNDGWSIEYNSVPNYLIDNCDIAVSVESAQIIHLSFGSGGLGSDNGTTGYGLYLLAGRVQFQDVVFGGTPGPLWGVYFPPQMSTVVLTIQKGTWEGTGNNFMLKDKYGTTEGAADYIPTIEINNFIGGTVDLGGAFAVTINNSDLQGFVADTNTNVAAAATQRVTITNSNIRTTLTWAQTGTSIWTITNTRFIGDGAITTPFSSQFFTNYAIYMQGNRFEGASFTADIKSLNGAQQFNPLITLADTATFQIQPRNAVGVAVVSSSTPAVGMFGFATDANVANVISDPQADFSITKGTAAKTNVYADGVNRGFWIENKKGASRNYRVQFIGAPAITGNI